MRKINADRVQIIMNAYKSTRCESVVTDTIKRFLKGSPSYYEKGSCYRKGCMSSMGVTSFPSMSLKMEVFNYDLRNLEVAILGNFPEENQCQKCHNRLIGFDRIYNQHLFIEVIQIFL